MKTISQESLDKRLAYLEKKIRSRRKWCALEVFQDDSDQQHLRRFERSCWTLLILLFFQLWRMAPDFMDQESFLSFAWFLQVAIGLYFAYLMYALIRIQWALVAFEYAGPQSIEELREKLAEGRNVSFNEAA